MNKLRIFCVFALCTIVFVACKKKEEKKEDPVVTGYTQADLSNGTWKITALTSSSLGDIWNNGLFVKPCNKDNTYYFKLNNTLTTYDTPTKCVPSDPDSTSGPYKFMASEKKIYLELLLGTIQIKDTTDIQQLNSSSLILNATYSGIPAVITFTH